MPQTHINAVDLNLLRVFDAMLEEGSVTRAGTRLGLTQSAVSHALARLRVILGDDLFVRTSRGMRPTPRAAEIGRDVHAALRQLQGVLSPRVFDPAETERRFTIMTGAYTNALLTPQLAARMEQEAPKAQLVMSEGAPDILEQLDANRIDFVIGALHAAPERVHNAVLLNETLVWVVRTGHPLTRGKVTLERLVATPHVAIQRQRREPDARTPSPIVMRGSWEDLGAFENELRAHGLVRRIGVTVPDTYSALAVVRRSDMAALVPRRLAEASAQAGFLAMVRPPYNSPVVQMNLFYLGDRLADPALKWMHGLIIDVASQLEPRK